MGGKGSQTIGYHYLFTKLAGLWRGPIDELVAIQVDEKIAWTGSVTATGTIAIDSPDLFGGEKKEGGVQGAAYVFMGDADQVLPGASTVSVGFTGPVKSTTIPDLKSTLGGLVSDLRGVMTFWYDGLITSMNPYPKPWKFRGRRATKGWHNDECWYPVKAVITMGGSTIKAMNPAHIIYQCLTDPEWGAGKVADQIDENSFILAANQLCSEGFGLCFNWTRQEDVDTFIQVVIDHITGALYTDRRTGKIVLRLIRDDYEPDDVPLYTYSTGLLSIEADDSESSEDATNEVVITGHDPVTDQDFEVRAHNIAAWQSQGEAISRSVERKGYPTRGLAQRIAQQELRISASGLKRFIVTIDRRGDTLAPAGVFRISAPDRNIDNMILRIGEIDYGTPTKREIKIKAIEDVFGLPQSSFTTPVDNGWTPPPTEAEPSPETLLIEAGYRDALLRVGETDTKQLDATDALIGQLARAPNSTSYQYDLATKASGDADYTIFSGGSFTGHAETVGTVAPLDDEIELTNISDVSEDNIGQAIMIGTELALLVDWDPVTSIATVERGAGDTVPQSHIAGTSVWMIDDDLMSDRRTYATGEVVNTKVLTRTASAVLALADASAETITLVSRHAKPYPPGDVKVGGDSIFDQAAFYSEPVITWAHRDRLLQADHIVSHAEGSVGPEAGTTYNIRVYDPSDVLLRDETGITTDTWTYETSMQGADGDPSSVRIELESERDTLVSWQFYDFEVALTFNQSLQWITGGPSPGGVVSNADKTWSSGPSAGGDWYKAKSDGARDALSGSWYFEVTITDMGGPSPSPMIGIAVDGTGVTTSENAGDSGRFQYFYTGQKRANGIYASYGASYGVGDVIGVGIKDLGSGNCELRFWKNGVDQGAAYTTLSNATQFEPHVCHYPNNTSDYVVMDIEELAFLPSGYTPW